MVVYAADEPEPGLGTHVRLVWDRRWTVAGVALVAVLVALGVSVAQTPIYRATTTIVVGEGNTLPGPASRGAPRLFTGTAADLLRSETVAAEVVQALRLRESPQALLDSVHVHVRPDSALVEVSVDSERASATPPSPPGAKQVAQELALAFVQLVRTRFRLAGAGGRPAPAYTAQVWDPARVEGKVEPRTLRNVLVALVLGLLLGLVAALAQDLVARRLRTREEIERVLGAPVVGRAAGGDDPAAYDALAAGLRYLAADRPLHVVGVDGPQGVATGLARAYARAREATVVVEAEAGAAAGLGAAADGAGLVDVLSGTVELDEALRAVPGDEDLDLLPHGVQPAALGDSRQGPVLTALLDRLASSYRHVVVAGGAAAVAASADGVVLGVRPPVAAAELREAHARVARVGGRLVGAILVGPTGAEAARAPAFEPVPEPVATEDR